MFKKIGTTANSIGTVGTILTTNWPLVMSTALSLFFGTWAWFTQWGYLPAALVVLVAFGSAVWAANGITWLLTKKAGSLPRAWQPISSTHIETRIRFERQPGSEINFIAPIEGTKNIYTWKQTYFRQELKNPDGSRANVAHVDSFFLIFNKPTPYAWPKIDAHGHDLPAYNFYLTSDRGAVLMFNDTLAAPVFEVIFPPVEPT